MEIFGHMSDWDEAADEAANFILEID